MRVFYFLKCLVNIVKAHSVPSFLWLWGNIVVTELGNVHNIPAAFVNATVKINLRFTKLNYFCGLYGLGLNFGFDDFLTGFFTA